MLNITEGLAGQTIIVSLNESKTIAAPYYLFVFENAVTHQQVKFIKHYSEDLSGSPDRYNEFSIDEALFDSVPKGQYNYQVYEQTSSTNTDATGLNQVECGKMILNPETGTVRNGYTTTTTVKGYAG